MIDKITCRTDTNNVEWAVDKNNNHSSIQYFGSKEKAIKALESLIDCSNCSNCSYCRNCSNCSNCRDCRDCSYCNDCRNCSYCNDCNDCRDCNDCSNCSYCNDCRDCRDCSYCNDCRNCSYCNDCNDCRDKEVKVKIPKIKNIHQKVFKAASKEGALNMRSWHTCKTTHCRAGWVVHLAKKKGKELEEKFSTPTAALMIYRESSDLKVNLNDFYKKNDESLEDMKKLAEEEALLLKNK